MTSVFFIFFVELFAFRWGTARMQRLSGGKLIYDAHGHVHGAGGMHAAHGPEGEQPTPIPADIEAGGMAEQKPVAHDHASDSEPPSTHDHDEGTGPLDEHPLAQILSVLILEFGVVFHSFIVGITLAVSVDFIPLFLVLIFHQLFEGLGLGTRLAHLAIFTSPRIEAQARARALEDGNSSTPKRKALGGSPLPKGYALFPWFGALAFALTLPLGVALGLGVRNSYDPNSATANIVSGIFDAFSSGILLYTGLVELLAHEFLFSRAMREAPLGRVVYAGFCVLLGAGLMSLLGRWA
jgi:solute carrier family 39 (zinc transporter), member 1/2/3